MDFFVLPLSAAPYHLSHTAIGAFGIAGVAGALAAMKAGNLADKEKANVNNCHSSVSIINIMDTYKYD